MVMDIILATRNSGKVDEIRRLLADMDVRLSFLEDHPGVPDIFEDGDTFLENAMKKAREAAHATGMWSLADDSGLVVDALGGRPGVHSARYAGKQGDYEANNRRLLEEMAEVPNGSRQARFECVLALVSPDGREWSVEGRCEGEIGRELKGSGGFGFDPLFYVSGKGKTMAELPMEVKNKISHRGRALVKMREILIEILNEKKEL